MGGQKTAEPLLDEEVWGFVEAKMNSGYRIVFL